MKIEKNLARTIWAVTIMMSTLFLVVSLPALSASAETKAADAASCVVLATLSDNHEGAEKWRGELQHHVSTQSIAIAYAMGHTLGSVEMASRVTGTAIGIIAAKNYELLCLNEEM
jgi:hypothetical protein